MKNVAVIEGGYSHEKVISLKSSQTIIDHLDREKYKVYRVRIDEDGWFYYSNDGKMAAVDRNDFSSVINGEKVNFDFAFIMIHGTPGEDGKLQAYFDMMSVPYSTCNQVMATLTFDKFICNRFLSELGFDVAKAVVVNKGEPFDAELIIDKVGLPCFVKPADGGSSFGVTKVKSAAELPAAIELATQDGNGTKALIESFLAGTEVTNGVYRGRDGVKVLPITEIVSENEFFDYDAKYTGQSDEITPARISDEMTQKIKAITGKVYATLSMTGIARVDYIIVGDVPHIIEINTVPGMSAESIVPKMIRAEGITLSAVFDEVIEVACS
jgi:D-alanine-D-alanine ligase